MGLLDPQGPQGYGTYSNSNPGGWRDPRDVYANNQLGASMGGGGELADTSQNGTWGTFAGHYDPGAQFGDLYQRKYLPDLAAFAQSQGWSGAPDIGNSTAFNNWFQQHLNDGGYTTKYRSDPTGENFSTGLFGHDGNLVRSFNAADPGDGTLAAIWAAMAAPVAISAVGAAGAAGAAGEAGGTGISQASLDYGALENAGAAVGGGGNFTAADIAAGLAESGGEGLGSGLTSGQEAYGALENAAADGTLNAAQQQAAYQALENGALPSNSSWWQSLQQGNYGDALRQGGSQAGDWAMNNPSTALRLGGMALGALGGAAGTGSGGSGGAGYTPKNLPGNFQSSVTPMSQPVQQQTGLLAAPQGQANSGLWQYMDKGTPSMQTTGLLGQPPQPQISPRMGYVKTPSPEIDPATGRPWMTTQPVQNRAWMGK